jgi:EAL domain-containing protein (putative c-di-GMP-specific phosphodiesterase class I)
MLNTHQLSYNDFVPDTGIHILSDDITDFIPGLSVNNIVNFHHHIQEKYLYHLSLINDLPKYLERNDLDLCYQPQINLETGKTKSVEALIRWQHKFAGSISPEIFIPLAEQTGHIHALTFWVLNHALEQLQAWKSKDLDIKVAVNLSMFNLHDKNFPLLVTNLLDKWSITPEQLILEITEGVIMHNPDHAIKIMSELCKLGVNLSLDDFGSGYSSLSHLAKLPINELKIDRSLIMGMDKNKRNATIVSSTIEMAKSLGISVVAEGVENMDIHNTLIALGCDIAQGFYFCKPLYYKEFTHWLLNSDWGI